jgi:hypothetical protein
MRKLAVGRVKVICGSAIPFYQFAITAESLICPGFLGQYK